MKHSQALTAEEKEKVTAILSVAQSRINCNEGELVHALQLMGYFVYNQKEGYLNGFAEELRELFLVIPDDQALLLVAMIIYGRHDGAIIERSSVKYYLDSITNKEID